MIKQMQPPNLFYRGSSMKGTFKPGDKLIIEKIPFNHIKKGDLIIFRNVKHDRVDFVVHRVVQKSSDGLATRGDNCRKRDIELVIEGNIIGKVVKYNRRGKIRKAWNGGLGRLNAGTLHFRQHIIRIIKFFLRKPYLMIKESGIATKLWHPEIEIVHFDTPNGLLVKYVHNGKTIAIYWADKGHWRFRRPYDLIIELKQKK
jgi:signal peptidase I